MLMKGNYWITENGYYELLRVFRDLLTFVEERKNILNFVIIICRKSLVKKFSRLAKTFYNIMLQKPFFLFVLFCGIRKTSKIAK